MHLQWPDPIDTSNDAAIAQVGKKKILLHPVSYAWQSLVNVIEVHLPYVGGG